MEALEEFLKRAIYAPGQHPLQPTYETWVLDYELMHKLVLKMLIDAELSFLSTLASSPRTCIIEPAGGLYDLRLIANSPAGSALVAEIEIKVWSPLTDYQISRQIAATRGAKLYYLLLGRTAAQWPHARVQQNTSGLGAKLSYKELIGALDALLAQRPSDSEFGYALAAAYRAALLDQRKRISGFGDPDA